jgi:hypothetical protein
MRGAASANSGSIHPREKDPHLRVFRTLEEDPDLPTNILVTCVIMLHIIPYAVSRFRVAVRSRRD